MTEHLTDEEIVNGHGATRNVAKDTIPFHKLPHVQKQQPPLSDIEIADAITRANENRRAKRKGSSQA